SRSCAGKQGDGAGVRVLVGCVDGDFAADGQREVARAVAAGEVRDDRAVEFAGECVGEVGDGGFVDVDAVALGEIAKDDAGQVAGFWGQAQGGEEAVESVVD